MPSFQVELTPEEEHAEIWRAIPIPVYGADYEVSNFGRVQSLKNYHGFMPGRILSLSTYPSGYVKVTLSRNSILKTFYVHDLVASAFAGPKPPKHEVNHINGVKSDNRAENLEYKTKKGNMEHASRTGLLQSGDRHYSRRRPELVARGDRNGSRTRPDRQVRGEWHPQSTISDAIREAIVAEYVPRVVSQSVLARKYGVSKKVIQRTLELKFKRP